MQSIVSMRVLIVIFFLLTITNASNSWQRPQRNDESSVADAVRYLQELDNYYSHLSRPRAQIERTTRSITSINNGQIDHELEAAIALLRLDAIDRIYARHSRPRFGKRNYGERRVTEIKKGDEDKNDWQTEFRLGER